MKKIIALIAIVVFVTIGFVNLATAEDGPLPGDGPAPNSGDGISDGSGFEVHKGAPNAGDGIPDGSGY